MGVSAFGNPVKSGNFMGVISWVSQLLPWVSQLFAFAMGVSAFFVSVKSGNFMGVTSWVSQLLGVSAFQLLSAFFGHV
jgi:hypothetical protein